MADLNIDKQASDLFSLGSDFKAQDSSSNLGLTLNEALNADGDIHARDESDSTTQKRARYTYVGTDLGAGLTAKVGQVVNAIKVTAIEIVMAAQQAVQVTLEGHNHAVNAHAAAASGEYDGYGLDLATILGATAQQGFDVPVDFAWTNANADSDLVSLTLRFSVDHLDAVVGNGDHGVGGDSRGLLTVTAQYIGVPSLTTTGYNLEASDTTDANQDFDKFSVTGSKALARTTA